MSAELKLATAKLPRATHSGIARFGSIEIECHNLDDGDRMITQRAAVAAITGGSDSGNLAAYIDGIPNKPDGFAVGAKKFSLRRGGTASGITAEQFIKVVTLYAIGARDETLHHTQRDIGRNCLGILFASAGVGITKMIDEATGYRPPAPPTELERKYQLYLLEAPDASRDRAFAPEYFREMCRLFKYAYVPGRNPAFAQWFTRRFIYDAIDLDVARRQKTLNPEPHDGSLHYGFWTEGALPILQRHIAIVVTLMEQSADPADFYMRFDHKFRGTALQLAFGSA